jgi:hypothetical protein
MTRGSLRMDLRGHKSEKYTCFKAVCNIHPTEALRVGEAG